MRQYYTRKELSNDDYHARAEISASQIKKFIATDPFYYKHYYPLDKNKMNKAALEFGTLIHDLVLEPDSIDLVAVPDDVRRGTKKWAEYENENDGATLIKQSDYDKACRLVDSVLANPDALAILDDAIIEHSVVWKCEQTGLDLRARADAIKGECIIDLKTCNSLKWFHRDAFEYGYHVQAAHYLAGFEKQFFYLLVVEKEPPYKTQVLEICDADIDFGRRQRQTALARMKQCMTENNWPRDLIESDYLMRPTWLENE